MNKLVDVWLTKGQLFCIINALKEYSWTLGGHELKFMHKVTDRNELETILQHLNHVYESRNNYE